ncbi:HAD-IC family P-type ATPase [Clostridium sp. YIM B02551]|uniref:HAD-IC family P-type ATPase n=1 Tax=Clostridium sp. YIM B02551 TaxID=2910679 RepID=UPI001EEB5D23|nr:HAD-IC family P-type ATPase [Clostridium sp. YIM B02551]
MEGTDYKLGLTKTEVEQRVKAGLVNVVVSPPSRTWFQIIRANVFTRFSAINLVLAAIVIVAGSPKNALFAFVIITNSIIGIFQETRAKKTIEELSLLSKSKVKVIRDGIDVMINSEEVVLDDVIILEPGIQLVTDSVLLPMGDVEVDESMLTGESDYIGKKKGDNLLSGSFIVSGYGYGKVIKVGEDTYAAKLSREAKKFKVINSEMQGAINKILKYIMWLIVPIGVLLIVTQILFTKSTWQEAFISAVAGVVGMVPEGLVLLTSATFLVGVIRLSKYKTLVQELPATEVLARVDTMCIDKTGTITEGKLKIIDIIPWKENDIKDIKEILGTFIKSFPGGNSTFEALRKEIPIFSKYIVKHMEPFDSTKKWSGIEVEEIGSFVLGAPEMIVSEDNIAVRSIVEQEAEKGRRVLILAHFKNKKLNENLPEDIEPMAILLMEDIIRKDANETLAYFRKQGVNIKIISGDNPITVASVSKKVGVENSHKYIDARNLPEDIEELSKVIEENVIFGRVTPYQKQKLVKALQARGRIVAMTGDGINDVLALKESDCGIAMASGSDATKAVAQLVLLESNFNALPKVVEEGRKMINNLERVSELYLSKTVYSILLSLVFALIFLPFPYDPIQLSLVGSISIGFPSMFLALIPNKALVHRGFLKRVLSISIPNGISISLGTLLVYLIAYYQGRPIEELRTLSILVSGCISLLILLNVSKPLNLFKGTLVALMAFVFFISFAVRLSADFFGFSIINIFDVILITAVVAVSWAMNNVFIMIEKNINRHP